MIEIAMFSFPALIIGLVLGAFIAAPRFHNRLALEEEDVNVVDGVVLPIPCDSRWMLERDDQKNNYFRLDNIVIFPCTGEVRLYSTNKFSKQPFVKLCSVEYALAVQKFWTETKALKAIGID